MKKSLILKIYMLVFEPKQVSIICCILGHRTQESFGLGRTQVTSNMEPFTPEVRFIYVFLFIHCCFIFFRKCHIKYIELINENRGLDTSLGAVSCLITTMIKARGKGFLSLLVVYSLEKCG